MGVIGYSVFRYCPQLPPVTQPLSALTSGSTITRLNRCYKPLAVSATGMHRLSSLGLNLSHGLVGQTVFWSRPANVA